VTDIVGGQAAGDPRRFVTTDHISPAGSIKADSPGGATCSEHQVA
jgi:aconitate hydratase